MRMTNEAGIVEELDDLRFRHPGKALIAAREARRAADPPLRARLYGVSASCLRMLCKFPEGKGCIKRGLKIADGDRLIRGELLQRLSYLLRDENRPELALELNKLVLLEHANNSNRVGRCLVDRGVFLYAAGRPGAAASEFRRSLKLLDPDDKRNAFSANQNLATCLVEEGYIREAMKYAAEAERLEEAANNYSKYYLHWLIGDLKSASRPSTVEECLFHYSLALDLCMELSDQSEGAAAQTALIGMKVITKQLMLGLHHPATQTAHRIGALAARLNRNEAIADILLGLRYIRREQLTLELALRIDERIGRILGGATFLPAKRRERKTIIEEFQFSGEAVARITRIDTLRYTEPLRALAEARTARHDADPPEKAALLGVAASCHRGLYSHQKAKACIKLALKIGGKFLNIKGDLYQRLVYLLRDEGRFQLALEVNKEALLAHACVPSKIGQCLADRGNLLHAVGRVPEAVLEFRRSLELLDHSKDKRNIFSAQQNLATCLVHSGDFGEALELAKRASELGASDAYSSAHLHWLFGDIYAKTEKPSHSLSHYTAALDCFSSIAFHGHQASTAAGQAALVGTKVVQGQLGLGRLMEARETTRRLQQFATPLSQNRIVSEALMKLKEAKEITDALLVELALVLERGLGKVTQAQGGLSD